MSMLDAILARTRNELARRRVHPMPFVEDAAPRDRVVDALRRPAGAAPRVIAEIKYRSPSAGEIRPWRVGDAVRVARDYEAAGAAAVSVLADAPAFGGSNLAVRRVAKAVDVPVLYKGFVLDPLQLDLARALGAELVLLLVRALSEHALQALVEGALQRGLEPLVEAASDAELERALGTPARVVGINARDLATFAVDPVAAQRQLEATPSDRVAIFMSGIRSAADLAAVASGRADAVLIGEGLMRTPAPGDTLRRWLQRAK